MEAFSGDAASAAEALRLKGLAEERFRASSVKSALKYARRAKALQPNLDGIDAMIAALQTLRSPPSDHYAVLHLQPLSSSVDVRRQFNALSLALRPHDKKKKKQSSSSSDPIPAAEEAFKRVADSFLFLSDRSRKRELDIRLREAIAARAAAEAAAALSFPAAGGTFWTACATCRLLHEFDRQYLGQYLLCPRCERSFLAIEAAPKLEVDSIAASGEEEEEEEEEEASKCRVTAPRSKSTSRPRIPPGWSSLDRKRAAAHSASRLTKSTPRRRVRNEKTLAEIQDEIAMGRKRAKEKERRTVKQEVEELFFEEEEGAEAIVGVIGGGDMGLMAVEDSDFYDFDKRRTDKCFKKGQVWAVYDDDDGMPRHYGLIDDVRSSNLFRAQMSWLDIVQCDGDAALPRASCGRFRVGKKKLDIHSVNMFSHLVDSERAAMELYRIYPRKGSVWALYKEGSFEEEGEGGRSYDIIVLLTSFSEMHGLSMAYLEKVEGFKTIFRRREIGLYAVKLLRSDELQLFSHQIPARKLSGIEGINLPRDCWELDPASLPADLLCVNSKR